MSKINKSSRHSKITGDFAENMVLYWLSKNGFESAKVDHTGIDLIARNPITKELMGISVKSRSRDCTTEKLHLNIPNDNFEKMDVACEAFGCAPYFAIVVDIPGKINIFVLSQSRFLQLCPLGKTVAIWKMSDDYLEKYKNDQSIMNIELQYALLNWWT